jgi:hypothetical protein
LDYLIKIIAAGEFSVLNDNGLYFARSGENVIRHPVDVLLENEFYPLATDIHARKESVSAAQGMFKPYFHFRHEGVNAFPVQPSEVFAKRLHIFMARMFHIPLVVGVVDHTLQIALIIAHFHFKSENILFHRIPVYVNKDTASRKEYKIKNCFIAKERYICVIII